MNKKGISLIVLVITIIIMIILAAAIILSLANNGIIGNAKDAVTASDMATLKNAKAIIDGEIEIAKSKGQDLLIGTTYNEYIVNKLNDQGIDTSKYYFTEKGILPVPEGFVVSTIEEEKEISTGVVIYEGTTPVTTSNHSTAVTTRNQFVWVPVKETSKFKMTTTYNGTITSPSDNRKEPAEEVYITGMSGATTILSPTNDLTGEYAEYDAMKESVKKYGGFYIARYEAGKEGTGTIVSKKDAVVWDDIQWGNSMTNIGTVGAVYKSRQMYKDSSSIVSTLCYGVQWDAALQFIHETDSIYPMNSIGKGNYTGILKNAGFYSVNNIYDMAGNAWEWTMEADSTILRAIRGGGYTSVGTHYPASYRYSDTPVISNFGFRVALYIK